MIFSSRIQNPEKMPSLKKFTWLLIPVLFLVYSAPGAIDYLFYFPDEKYYTDAALQMLDKNDWFTPYKADGTPRFLKPIITYWVLLGSYTILGISPFSSRLLFWLAGAILTVIVYRMTLSITKSKASAVLAGFITAANPLVLMSASRSIPDILLVLFLTLSAWGFIEIMLNVKPKQKHYWMAYLGAALAFETKGLPGAAFAGLSFLYLWLNPWKPVKLKQLIHPAAIITAIIVALSWFIIMYVKHGTEYLSSFFADQVGYRVSSKVFQVVKNVFLGIVNLIAFTIPWLIIAISNPKQTKEFLSGASSEKKSLFGFIALWIIAVIAMSGAVFKFYDRYLLPVIPLISVFFSIIIVQTETRYRKPAKKTFLVLNVVVLLANLLYATFIYTNFTLVAGTTLGVTLLTIIFLQKDRITTPGIVLANLVLLLWFNGHVLLNTLLMPNPGKQLTESIYSEQANGDETIYVYGNIRIASAIRIYSNNNLNVVSMDTLYVLPPNRNHLLVFNKNEEHLLDLSGYRITQGSEEWKNVPAVKFHRVLQPAVINVKNSGTEYFIARLKDQ